MDFALRTKHSPYEVACLVRDFPQVFDAWYLRVYASKESQAKRKQRDFHGWREATRDSRINKIAQRNNKRGRRR